MIYFVNDYVYQKYVFMYLYVYLLDKIKINKRK